MATTIIYDQRCTSCGATREVDRADHAKATDLRKAQAERCSCGGSMINTGTRAVGVDTDDE